MMHIITPTDHETKKSHVLKDYPFYIHVDPDFKHARMFVYANRSVVSDCCTKKNMKKEKRLTNIYSFMNTQIK